MGNTGANMLAETIIEVANRQIGKQVYAPMLGTLRSDMSLVLDDSPEPIPAGDWLTTVSGVTSGDRVVVLPVNYGTVYVVIGRLENA